MSIAMDDSFISEGLKLIFEDVDNSKKFEDLEKQSDEIFETLNKSDKDVPFNIRLLVDPNETDTEKVKLNINNDDEETIKFKVNPNESKIKPSMVTPDNVTNIKLNVPAEDLDVEKFKLKVPKKDVKKKDDDNTKVINLKLNKDKKSSSNVVNIDMKVKDQAPSKDLEASSLHLDLQSNDELKDLLKSDNPNQMLVSSINILKDSKLAIDKLVTLLPNDDVLVKTQNIVMELLGRINEDHEQLVKDKDRCKELAVNVAKFILDLKNYLKIKFTELKDNVEDTENRDTNLDQKMDQIQSDVKKVKKEENAPNENKKHSSSDDNTIIDNDKTPSIQTISGGQNNFGTMQFNH